jgi:hypothetical protein
MPFNDPHTAAPSLWAWRQDQGWDYECSAASFEQPDRARLSLESWLLWQHRLQHSVSTLCNHGRFHARYSKSANRSSGRRGRLLSAGEINPAGGPSSAPLCLHGMPKTKDWMGLAWSPWVSLQTGDSYAGPALYRIALEDAQQSLLYIGETRNFRQRVKEHVRRTWAGPVVVSFSVLAVGIAKYVLHELENDLIGAHVEQIGSAPVYQFTDGRDAS